MISVVAKVTGGCGGGGGDKDCVEVATSTALGLSSDCACPAGWAGLNVLPTASGTNCIVNNGGVCLSLDEPIVLSNGTCILASEVRDGDKILGMGPDGDKREQMIHGVRQSQEALVRVTLSTGQITCSVTHPFFAMDGSTILAPCLDPDDLLVSESGAEVRVINVLPAGNGIVVAWQCTPDQNFFASGVLHHNKTAVAPQV